MDSTTKPACGATTRSGTPCRNIAGFKTDHVGIGRCYLHLGSTRNHVRAAQQEIAVREVARLGLAPDATIEPVDPKYVLEMELYRTHVNVRTYEMLVGELGLSEGRRGLYARPYFTGDDGEIEAGEARPHVLVGMYNDERKHLAAVAVAAARAGVEERRQAMAEEQAQWMARVLRGVLTDLGVVDHPDAPAIVRKHLTLVAGQVSA